MAFASVLHIVYYLLLLKNSVVLKIGVKFLQKQSILC